MRRAGLVALIVGVLAGGAGCKKHGSQAPIARRKDAAAAVVVDAVGQVASADEHEPDDDAAHAMPLALPVDVHASLRDRTDLDFFRVAGGAGGELSAALPGVEGLDLWIELRAGDGRILAHGDRGSAGVAEGLPNVPLEAGHDYLVVVGGKPKLQPRSPAGKPRGKGKGKGAPPEPAPPAPSERAATAPVADGVPYRLTLALAAPRPGAEREPDDDGATAGELALGAEGTGYLGWDKDRDCWKVLVAAPAAGATPTVIDLAVDGVDGVALSAEIGDAHGAAIVQRKGERGQSLLVHGLEPTPVSPGGFYLVCLTASRSQPQASYRLRAQPRDLQPDDEREPDDDADHALAIAAPLAAHGLLHGYLDGGDTDVVRLPATGGATAELTVEPPRDADVVLEVASGDGKVLGQADLGRAGAAETLAGLPLGAGLLVRLSAKVRGDGGEPYTLRWTVTGATE